MDNQLVLDYWTEENAYHEAFLDPHKKLVDTIFEEFKGRTDETEESVPYVQNAHEYRLYFEPGTDYRTRSRNHPSDRFLAFSHFQRAFC